MIQIRVDDFPWTKEEEKDKHSLSSFSSFLDILFKYNCKPIIGVIPNNCTEEDYKFLRDTHDISIGMHGINHDETRLDEFSHWETKSDIKKKLNFFKNVLELKTDKACKVYMPPHNFINIKTLQALQETKFKAFTGGPGTLVSLQRPYGNLVYIHSAKPFEYGRSDEMNSRETLEYLLGIPEEKLTTLTLHWTWEYNIGLENLDLFLSKISEKLSKEEFNVCI